MRVVIATGNEWNEIVEYVLIRSGTMRGLKPVMGVDLINLPPSSVSKFKGLIWINLCRCVAY